MPETMEKQEKAEVLLIVDIRQKCYSQILHTAIGTIPIRDKRFKKKMETLRRKANIHCQLWGLKNS